MNKLAQIDLAPKGGFRGKGPLGLEGDVAENAPGIFNKLLSTTIGIITVVAFIWFTFLFITGAVSVMTAGGDKAAVEAAKKKLTSGVLGLVIVIAGIFLVELIGSLLGIENILNPAAVIRDITQ